MTKRGGGLVVAVLLAALSTGALISYVRGVEDKAFKGAETVEVFVATRAIPSGTTAEAAIAASAFERTGVPRKVVVDGAVTSLEQIRGKVAAVTILAGEQIVSARFVAASEALSGLAIPANHQAMSVEVDAPPGVAGFVGPGTRVSVIAHLDAEVGPGRTESRAQFLLQDVQVLAVGHNVAPVASGDRDAARKSQATSDRVLLTLAVTPGEAEKLAFAIFEGDVYFTLLPPGGKAVSTGGRTQRNWYR